MKKLLLILLIPMIGFGQNCPESLINVNHHLYSSYCSENLDTTWIDLNAYIAMTNYSGFILQCPWDSNNFGPDSILIRDYDQNFSNIANNELGNFYFLDSTLNLVNPTSDAWIYISLLDSNGLVCDVDTINPYNICCPTFECIFDISCELVFGDMIDPQTGFLLLLPLNFQCDTTPSTSNLSGIIYTSLSSCIDNCGNTFINSEEEKFKKLKEIKNLLGQAIPYRRNTPLFYIYDDGTVEKRIVIE